MTQSNANALVTLTSAQADALEAATGIYCDHDIIAMHVENPEGWSDGIYAPLNGLPLRTVALALYVGYDVEQTPEERIKAEYERKHSEGWAALGESDYATGYASGYRAGIRFTLDALGMKIDGVNKTEVSE